MVFSAVQLLLRGDLELVNIILSKNEKRLFQLLFSDKKYYVKYGRSRYRRYIEIFTLSVL